MNCSKFKQQLTTTLSFLLVLLSTPAFGTTEQAVKSCIDAVRVDSTQQNEFISVLNQYLQAYQPLRVDAPETTGIEVEAVIPATTGLQELANQAAANLEAKYGTIAKEFSWRYIKYGLQQRRFTITYQPGASKSKKVLVLTEDLSIVSDTGKHPLEFISPINDEEADFIDFMEILGIASQFGVTAEPNSGGIHVHQGFANATGSEIGVYTLIMSRLEKDLFNFSHTAPMRLSYVLPMAPEFINAVLAGHLLNQSPQQIVANYFAGPTGRYRATNWASLLKFETVETRLINSTLNPKIILFYVKLTGRLLRAIRTKNMAALGPLIQDSGPLTVEQVSLALGLRMEEINEVRSLIASEYQALQKNPQEVQQRKWLNMPGLFQRNVLEPFFFPDSAPEGWRPVNSKPGFNGN